MNGIYATVMDPKRNPLSTLRPQHKFQLMVYLSSMWTAIFCATIGSWMYYGELMVGHLLFAAGILITAAVFSNANKASAAATRTYRDFARSDRTPRYDDVWGA